MLFELNIKNYPASGNVYDSMGDSYLAKADTIKAIELFTKAIEVGSLATKEKLEKLKRVNYLVFEWRTEILPTE